MPGEEARKLVCVEEQERNEKDVSARVVDLQSAIEATDECRAKNRKRVGGRKGEEGEERSESR